MRNRLLILACLVSFILLAFAIRAYDLDGKSIWSDESLSLYRAQKSVPFILSGKIVIQGVPTQDTQPPLYFLLLHALMSVAGPSTFVAKYLSVLASLLIIPLLYVLGCRLVDNTAGLLTALIGTLSPLYLWYAQEIRMYTLLVALSIASVYTLIRAMGNGKPDIRWGAAYLVVTAAAIYTHYSTFFLLGFQGLFLATQALRRRRWWLLVPMAVAGLVALPVIPFVIRRLGLGAERDFHFVPLWIMLRDLWNAFSLGLSVDFYRVYPLDLVFLGLLILGVVALLFRNVLQIQGMQRHWETALFLLGYLCVPILALYTASYIKPMYQGARHLMIVSPAYYLLLGAGLLTLHRGTRPALIASLAVIVLGTGLSTSNYFNDSRYLKDDLRGLARYFQTHRGPNDALILSDGVLTLAFQYYLGEDAPLDSVPRFGTPLQPDFPNHIRSLMERYDRLWFMSPHPPVREWLNDHLFQSDEIYFEGMNIPVVAAVYESEDPYLVQAPGGLRGQETELEQLTFHGYAVPHNPVRAGEVLVSDLYWEPRDRLERNYHIAVTLTDDTGNIWGRGDVIPFRGLHPTSTWEPHTVLRQWHELRVNLGAPPGVYHLQLRVYDPVSGDALSGDRGRAFIDLGDIEVVRPDAKFSPRAVTPEVATDVNFGHRLRLLGFDLATRMRRPGDEIPLATYWQALGNLSRDYQVWLRLMGADGRLLTEKTVSPTSGSYPTSQWRAGDVLQGQHRLIVPADTPPGDVAVVLSVVDPDGRPLTAHQLRWLPIGGTDVRLATIEIAPHENIVTEPPPMQHPLNAELAGAIGLLGYDLRKMEEGKWKRENGRGKEERGKRKGDSNLQPPTSNLQSPISNLQSPISNLQSPISNLQIDLYWQAKSAIEGNFKVTVQVLSIANQIVAQHDSVPANWTRPTTGWLPGEVITDSHTLTINPGVAPGTYKLIAAMYDPVSNSRLPVIQDGEARDHVVLGRLEIRD